MSTAKTPVMVLQEFTVKEGLPPPEFQVVFSVAGTHENRFDYAVLVAGITATGTGPSKQVGKHEAAHNALKILEKLNRYNPIENPVTEFKMPLQENGNLLHKVALNCIAELQNLCMENKLPPPHFNEISSVGPPHAKEFTFECKISSISTEAKGNTKKMAKQLAAREMLARIKDAIPEIMIIEKEKENRLLDSNQTKAAARYQELLDVVPNKSVKIDELAHTLKKLMIDKNLVYQEFEENLSQPTEQSLSTILQKLEVEYVIEKFQENPCIVVLVLKIETPFTILASGESFDKAKEKALIQTFEIMQCYMQIEIESSA